MVSNKKRLYIAVYPSGITGDETRKYHWAFLIGPKNEDKKEVSGMRYHVKNPTGFWIYEAKPVKDVKSTISLLARVCIAKITDEKRLLEIFRNTPILQNDPNFNCRIWLIDALSRVSADGTVVGRAELDWEKIEQNACVYVGEKIASGRYDAGVDMYAPKPRWDLLEEKELVT
ncbi:uncharacterized protein F4812DRAFT_404186 [Daldinia caldariorum]|uniref:uncharacterized protein n=1 Tax=Daldinia caldariorum TaxID=326644 RepID=UPI0020084204|nr:uncharacterized protein F4812DRAFT_404186 [Daldinia caldariorum]KAI1467654.1 hypothetical protein F4812DRAFT_404186 [Daldinia caldariorum]